jgi:hypothetical protein
MTIVPPAAAPATDPPLPGGEEGDGGGERAGRGGRVGVTVPSAPVIERSRWQQQQTSAIKGIV